jgi:hypothetical protein
MTPHKHSDAIIDWAAGAIIQHRRHTVDSWANVPGNDPDWSCEGEFRAAPDSIKFRNALFVNRAGEHWVVVLSNTDMARYEKTPTFVRWVSELLEVTP